MLFLLCWFCQEFFHATGRVVAFRDVFSPCRVLNDVSFYIETVYVKQLAIAKKTLGAIFAAKGIQKADSLAKMRRVHAFWSEVASLARRGRKGRVFG